MSGSTYTPPGQFVIQTVFELVKRRGRVFIQLFVGQFEARQFDSPYNLEAGYMLPILLDTFLGSRNALNVRLLGNVLVRFWVITQKRTKTFPNSLFAQLEVIG